MGEMMSDDFLPNRAGDYARKLASKDAEIERLTALVDDYREDHLERVHDFRDSQNKVQELMAHNERLTAENERLREVVQIAEWIVRDGKMHSDDCAIIAYDPLEALEEALEKFKDA
jgi:regulator of replication initiation timing